MNRWSLAACSASLLLAGAAPITRPSTISREKIGDSIIILGDLGLPVGQETTITGLKKSVGPLQNMFSVETIDGKPAALGLRVRVNGIGKWPDGTKATLRGNEVGTLQFIHLDETNFGPDDDRWKGPHQKLFLSFGVSKVAVPDGLKIEQGE